MSETEIKIEEAKYRLLSTKKGSKCYNDTRKWLNRLYEQRAKERKKL